MSKKWVVKIERRVTLPAEFTPLNGWQSMSYNAARAILMKYLKKAVLSKKDYTLHCLRHACASDMLNAGMRLECVQSLLGHVCRWSHTIWHFILDNPEILL